MNSPADSDKSKVLVIGVGNGYRGDDAFGLLAVRALRAKVPASINLLEHNGEGASLIDSWQGFHSVIIIDAIESGAEPGVIVRIDAIRQKIPPRLFHRSSHQFGVVEGIETARALGRLPEGLLIYGVIGESFDPGKSVSKTMSSLVDTLVTRVLQELTKSVPF